LEIETKTHDEIKVVKLKGRLAMGPPLDRFNATMSDSSGIGTLVRHLTAAKQAGGAIRLLKPSKFTTQTLKMVGLLNLFSTFEELPQAVASFQ